MNCWQIRLHRILRKKQFWSTLAGVVIVGFLSLYAFYIVLWKDSSSTSFYELIARIGLGMFLVTSAVYLIVLSMAISGWVWIVGTLSGNWQWFRHIQIYCATTITRRIPGSVWYLFGRIVLYERLHVSRSLTAIASGLEFSMIILGGLLVVAVTWPIALNQQTINPLWLIASLITGILLLNPLTLRVIIRRINHHGQKLDLNYCHLLAWVVLYAGVWCGGGCILFVLTTTVHPVSWNMLPVSIGVWAMVGLVATLLSFVPLGVGQELTLTALLSPYVGTPEALVIALLMRGVLTINEFVWAIIVALPGLREFVQVLREERAARKLSQSS